MTLDLQSRIQALATVKRGEVFAVRVALAHPMETGFRFDEFGRKTQAFNSRDVQQLQSDDAANPGMLWVGQGETLWREAAGATQKSCASCHGDAASSMRGVAARYPVFDASENNIVNLEGRINQCRIKR
jgi:cytochrome c